MSRFTRKEPATCWFPTRWRRPGRVRRGPTAPRESASAPRAAVVPRRPGSQPAPARAGSVLVRLADGYAARRKPAARRIRAFEQGQDDGRTTRLNPMRFAQAPGGLGVDLRDSFERLGQHG